MYNNQFFVKTENDFGALFMSNSVCFGKKKNQGIDKRIFSKSSRLFRSNKATIMVVVVVVVGGGEQKQNSSTNHIVARYPCKSNGKIQFFFIRTQRISTVGADQYITDSRRNVNELKRCTFLPDACTCINRRKKPARRHNVLLSLNSHVRTLLHVLNCFRVTDGRST